MEYSEFLKQKDKLDISAGFLPDSLHSNYHFPFQQDIVKWSLQKGKALIAEDCGLGKGLQILEWCHQVHSYTDRPVILFAPPGVKVQFKYEAEKFGFDVNTVQEQNEIVNSINVTNYERLIVREKIDINAWQNYQDEYAPYKPEVEKRNKDELQVIRFRFNPECFSGIALDEGSILKHYNSKTRERITQFAENIHFRLAATATPAPNDFFELANYAEFLGIMSGKQVRAKFFIQDGQTSQKFRIMRPAWKPFWKWVASWAVMIRNPSDLGYEDSRYTLPVMNEYLITLEDPNLPEGEMFAREALGLQEQSRVKRLTVKERCQVAIDLCLGKSVKCKHINTGKEIETTIPTDKRVVVWCERNDESELLARLIPDSIEVSGKHSEEYKEKAFMDFARDKGPRVMITKPSMGGLGLNWQVCHYAIEVNIDHSYEKMYQADKRLHRFMQENDVNFFRIAMNTEGNIQASRNRKRKQSDIMYQQIVKEMEIHELSKSKTKQELIEYTTDRCAGKRWEILLGDSVENVLKLDNHSVGQAITSVPFPSMYVYTNSNRDIGNYEDIQQCVDHTSYVFKNLLPKMMPGRIVEIHLAQAIAFKNRDGFIGLMDFRGPMIKMMTDLGYLWHGEITIEKDPQTERARSNTLGLLQKTLGRDASNMRSSVSDYILQFRSPGDNIEPIEALLAHPKINGNYDAPGGWITMEMWINWASNVWYKHRQGMKWWEGIDVTNVCGSKKGSLGIRDARGKDDEKHLCELQLDVIERLCALHSNPGDLIVDPFNGIGSTGFQVLQMGRRYWGSELKESYWEAACKNLTHVEQSLAQVDMFSMMDIEQSPESIHKSWMIKRGITLDKNSSEVIESTRWQQWQSYMKEGDLI